MPVQSGWRRRPILSDAAWRWQARARLGFGHDAARDTPRPETLFADSPLVFAYARLYVWIAEPISARLTPLAALGEGASCSGVTGM